MLLLAILVSVILLLSEVASNTAIAALFLPLLMAAAARAGMDARMLMLPAAVAASCGFMLPIATPPNALAFATGHVSFREMARAGALVDVAAVVLMVLVLWFWSLPMLGVDVHAVRPR
jgi:sodium-dependent dicarboxylate transporter 2/3/5